MILSGRDYTREKVRIRDKHKCQECDKKWNEGERRFDVHHLNGMCGKKSKSYDKVSEIDGLITYCHKCHMSVHATGNMGSGKLSDSHIKEIKKRLKKGEHHRSIAEDMPCGAQNIYARFVVKSY